jgi:ribosome-binding protein aMBF1 (putative translation factor)
VTDWPVITLEQIKQHEEAIDMKERYFGERDPLEIVDEAIQESPQAAAIRQAKQIAKAPSQATRFEQLLEERTKDAVEGAQQQVRQIAEAAEKKNKELMEKMELYQGVLQRIAEGKMTPAEVREFLEFRRGK